MDNIEVGTNGQAAFASLREVAWHGLGYVAQEPLPLTEFMAKAHLSGWNVRIVNLPDHFTEWNFHKDMQLVVRDNPFTPGQIDVLGQVGGRYDVASNEEVFQFADSILDGAGTWETMGSIANGTKVFGSMSLNTDDVIIDAQGAGDHVKFYMLAHSTHNGTGRIIFAPTPVRVVCQNTLNLAIRGITTSYGFKHTPGRVGKVEEARAVLGVTFKYKEAFEKAATELYQAAMTNQQFDDIIRVAYPEPQADAEKGAHKKWETKVDQIWDIYLGPTCANIKGTGWGGLNALTERIDWGRKPRKGDSENNLAAASGFDDKITGDKQELFDIVYDHLLV